MTSPPAGRGVKRVRAPDNGDEAAFLHGAASQQSSNYFAQQDFTQPGGGGDPFIAARQHADTTTSSERSASPGHPYPHPPLAPTSSHDSPEATAAAAAADTPVPRSTTKSSQQGTPSTSFRNVSACNRCRIRKNRCDQHLPACRACEKAGVKCVGFDPISRREIPRSYVYFLEERTGYLERLLSEKGIAFLDSEEFAVGKPGTSGSPQVGSSSTSHVQHPTSGDRKIKKESRDVDRLVSDIGMVSVKGASDSRYLGSTSGISFARVVFTALKKTVSRAPSELGGTRPSKASSIAAGADGTSMRDSFFGLHTKPQIKEAPFPDKELGHKLVNLYFQHANPQIPILHRGEFMNLFDRVYEETGRKRTARESFLLNMVFAIGAGIIMGADKDKKAEDQKRAAATAKDSPQSNKRQRLSNQEHQPEEYHASAIVHLESFLGSSPTADHPDGSGGGLEELQAVLLLAGFALLRPVAPGLWYIVGVAVRLGVDLGLHHEEGQDVDVKPSSSRRVSVAGQTTADQGNGPAIAVSERGRREWVRDLRRRLWWCVYSFDRLVSSCVGRPFGISDQAVTTEFPSMLDDDYITPAGFGTPPSPHPSPKVVAYHYFRLRLLQSEILQVLQYENAQRVHNTRSTEPNPYMNSSLPSPFLQNFKSFRDWRADVDRRLWEWRESAPTQQDTGVDFSPLFLDLNYWQAVIMLFRPSLTAPAQLAHEMRHFDNDVTSPTSLPFEDNEEFVLLKIAEAGQKVLKLYRQLHRIHLVNYTFLATHHLFMAGISFLYAIWHSPVVRSYLSLDDVDFTVLAATSVLGDLIEKCPPAEICRDAFDRMSKATIQMCLSTTGFGPSAVSKPTSNKAPAQAEDTPSDAQSGYFAPVTTLEDEQNYGRRQSLRPAPQFDMNLKDLFAEGEAPLRSLHRGAIGSFSGPGVIKQEPVNYPQQSNTIAGQSPPTDMNIDPKLQQNPQAFTTLAAPDVQMQFDLASLDDLDFDTFSQSDGMDPNLWGFGDGDVNQDWGSGIGGVDVMGGYWFGNGGV